MLKLSTLFLFISLATTYPTEISKTNQNKGSIKGVVSNEHEQGISNALIYLKKDNELIKVSTSDSLGLYEFSSLKADTYSINVSYVGYFKKEIKDIIVDKLEKEIDIKMKELRCIHGNHTH